MSFPRKTVALGAVIPLTVGCSRAPQIGILGSFFPAWLPCAIVGIVLTFGVHFLLGRLRLAHQLAPALLVYPAVATIITITLWLALFS